MFSTQATVVLNVKIKSICATLESFDLEMENV